jgi:hypothetical protein
MEPVIVLDTHHKSDILLTLHPRWQQAHVVMMHIALVKIVTR